MKLSKSALNTNGTRLYNEHNSYKIEQPLAQTKLKSNQNIECKEKEVHMKDTITGIKSKCSSLAEYFVSNAKTNFSRVYKIIMV